MAQKPKKQYDQFVISSLQSFAYAARTFNSLDAEAKARVFKEIPPASIHASNRCVGALMRMLSKKTSDVVAGRRGSAAAAFEGFGDSGRREGFGDSGRRDSNVGSENLNEFNFRDLRHFRNT